ncbi:receptor-type tyrosine-protein phosphatase F-like [Mya arenaria]|uniref:receptor-type tyrosine-protein phosphatase F-like n=1 Tax=Mya arenaria TaxID=6604 RepID=UPI0022E1DDEB|nr:receptor-type tyrosine-protein phosphatase F-like [Mya arenaria]
MLQWKKKHTSTPDAFPMNSVVLVNSIWNLPPCQHGGLLPCGGSVADICASSRRSKLSKKETENLSALYATVKKGRAARAGNANADTDNFHSVIIIENPDYESLLTGSSDRKNTPYLTEDNLELGTDEDDIFANETAKLFVERCGVYYNNAREVSKLNVSDLPEHVQNISLKELEEEFQKIPYGFVKSFEVSQTKLNMHKNKYRRIYPYDDTRVLVRGGDTDYINASYIDGFRRRNAYISTLESIIQF